MIVRCEIEDLTLSCAVRNVLLLPMPAEYNGGGAAVGSKPTASGGMLVSAVTGAIVSNSAKGSTRSSSTGALRKASRKESRMSAMGGYSGRTGAQDALFTPPARIIEAI